MSTASEGNKVPETLGDAEGSAADQKSRGSKKPGKGMIGSVRMKTLEMEESGSVDKETVASTELFFDLVFLTAVAKLNEAVQDSIGFSQYLAFFFTIWYFWLNSTHYSSIFGSDDIFHKLYYLVYGLGIVTFAMNVDGEWDTTAAYNVGLASAALKGINALVFARTWVGLYVSSTSSDSKAGADISQVEKLGMQKVAVLMLRNVGTGILYLVGSLCDSDYREMIWWAAILCEPLLVVVLTLLLTDDRSILTPPMEHFIERIEAFLIIALGFTILNLVEEPADFSDTAELVVNVGMGFMIVFNVKLLHFDVEVVDHKDHALLRGPRYTMAFMTLTGIVGAGLSMMGSGAGSVVALASSCITTTSTDTLVMESLVEGGDRRIDFYNEAIVHRRNEETKVLNSLSELDNSSDVEEDLEDEESSQCDISDYDKSQQLFVFGFAIVMVGEAMYRLIHKADYEDFKGAVLLYWTQFVCMLLAGPWMIFLYEGLGISAITLLSWGFGLSFFLVILNLLDEIIDVIKYNRKKKLLAKQKEQEQDQETGLISDDGSGKNKYVIENDQTKGDVAKEKETHMHGWASEGFFQGVTVRNDELIEEGHVEPRKVHTTELFFDLMFAASLKQLNGYLIEEEISYLEYLQYFTSTYFFWMSNTYYSSIFGNDDLFHKLFYAIFSVLIIYMAMFQSGGWGEDGYGSEYGVAAGILRILTALVYLKCYRFLRDKAKDPKSEGGSKISETERSAMNKMQFFMLRDGFAGLMWFLGAGYIDCRGTVFWAASSVDVISLILFGVMDSKDLIRPPLEHFAERIEGFMLVVLGFSIDGIALGVDEADDPKEMYSAALVGFLIVFFIKLLHFDCEVFEEDTHAMGRNQENLAWGLIWMITTGVTACGISLVGAGSEAIITEIQDNDEDIDSFYTEVYVYGLSLCLFSESALRFCHTPTYEDFFGSKFLYWFQMFLQIAAGFLILYVDSSIANSNYTVMFYYGIIYGVIVTFNLIDECIENYYTRRPDVYHEFLDNLEHDKTENKENVEKADE